jgi:tungstate transport system substrate-binding protein
MKKKLFKKIGTVLLVTLMCVTLFSGCGGKNEPVDPTPPPAPESPSEPDSSIEPDSIPAPYQGVLLMATTTSTDNTGLLDYLAPVFRFDTGWDLKWIAVGSGEAIQLGRDGEAAVLLVHSKAAEEEFVSDGYGVSRVEVMYNDYVIVGPPDGSIKYSDDAAAVFKQIMEESLVFVSRGDDSGTHSKEKSLWKAAEIENFESNPNYKSAGAGMGATLLMANEMKGYCLADRGTWLSSAKTSDVSFEIEIICEGDKSLFNQYSVIAVSPDIYADINYEGADAFIEWICSPEIQKLIGEFGVEEFGQPLFVPNAK